MLLHDFGPHPFQVQALYKPSIGYSQLTLVPAKKVSQGQSQFNWRRYFERIEEDAPDRQAQDRLPLIAFGKPRLIAGPVQIGDER